jgi:hypothetical protein
MIERAERVSGNTYRFHAHRDAHAVYCALVSRLSGVSLAVSLTHVDASPLSMEEAGLLVQELNRG